MATELTLLGTGTPTPLVHRAGSSYLVKLDDESILVDCGPGAVRRLLKKGVSPTTINTLLLTHLHYDHCVDYGYFTLVRWDQGAGTIPDLEVYGPEPTARMTEQLFGESGVYAPDLAARTLGRGGQFVCQQRGGKLPRKRPDPSVTEVAHGDQIEKPNWTVKVAEVPHAQPHLICMAYRLDTSDKSIVFGGDTAPTEKLTNLAEGADVLIHMCHLLNGVVTDPRITAACSGHLDCARTARDAKVKTLILVHLTEQLEQPGIRERVLFEAGEVFDGNIIFAEDLLDVPLGEIRPEAIR